MDDRTEGIAEKEIAVMNEHEFFEKFVLFLAVKGIVLTQYLKGEESGTLPSDERKIIIEDFLNSKVMLECRSCDRGYLKEIKFEPIRMGPTQIRCRRCNGTGKRLTSIRNMFIISKMV